MSKQTKMVKQKVDIDNLPPLTSEQQEELKALAAMPDEEIDTSDIPTLGDAVWENAVVGQFYKPIKEQVTVRIDADVLAWLKSSGPGYQTRLNQVLRKAMRQADTSVAN